MRPLLPLLLVAVVSPVAASAASSEAEPVLTLSVKSSAPRAAGSAREPRGRRDYAVVFHVVARSDQACAKLVVEYTYTALFDGRRSFAGSAVDYYETKTPARAATFGVRVSADAGDLVVFSGHGSCENDAGDVVATSQQITARVAVPAYACEEGPLRVFGARRARREDLLSRSTTVPVHRRQRLWSGYEVGVARGGRIAFGATECHRFRVVVAGPATFVPGDYARGSYGTSTLLGDGAAADFRGDQHAGGVETANAAAVPRGSRTGPSKVARFEIESLPKRLGRITRVRVRNGEVYVAGRARRRARYGTPVVVRAGEAAVVTCAPARACAARLVARSG